MALRNKLAALTAAAVIGAVPVAGTAQEFINILTGGTSGVYYPVGGAISQIFTKGIPEAKIQVQSTKASVENLNLLEAGRGELAFALGDSVKAAAEGDAEAGFPKPLEKLRGIAAAYPNFVQIVASEESGIKTLADLKGKALSVGAPKSGTELNARAILEAAGMSYDDLGRVEYLPFAESVELMKNRQLDATLQSAGLGVASLKDLSTSIPITIVAVPTEIAESMGAPFIPNVIPAGTYDGQSEDVPTVAIINYLVSSSEVSDELAYQMTKQIFENLDSLKAAHVATENVDVKDALVGMTIPVHPGAQKYYDEVGVKAE